MLLPRSGGNPYGSWQPHITKFTPCTNLFATLFYSVVLVKHECTVSGGYAKNPY